ncbi:hypothetical protein [Legionella genomosp. 1]|uniref:hypothetical protein n=1 Tax=Legionella genomosp. 1 TaxID=1093625 RepID=UPI00105430CE|nr:hypothetical protein [Legionella genomosp. 1]
MRAKTDLGDTVQIPAGIHPQIRLLACDFDNTLVNLKGKYASVLNHDLLIPILRWASLTIHLGIDTARDRKLDSDIGSSGGASITDLLKLFERFGIHFSVNNPNLVIASEDVTEFRNILMKRYEHDLETKNLFTKQKNADLHFIMQEFNKSSSGIPLRPEDILILDDTEGVVEWARKAGFKAIHVKHEFNKNTVDESYAYELAKVLGLEDYANDVQEHPENHREDPEVFLTVAKEYWVAKQARKENKLPAALLVHPLLNDLLGHFRKDPRQVFPLLKQLHGRAGYSQIIDEEYEISDTLISTPRQHIVTSRPVKQTLLGHSIQADDFYRVNDLLKLGASSNHCFDLGPNKRQIKPLVAAVILDCSSDILAALIKANAQIDLTHGDISILKIALENLHGKLLHLVPGKRQPLYEQLQLIVEVIQKQHGLDNYFNHLAAIFPMILKIEDANILAIFMNNLSLNHRQSLYHFVDISAQKNSDFSQQLTVEFFFQQSLKSLKEKFDPLAPAPNELAPPEKPGKCPHYNSAKALFELLRHESLSSPRQTKKTGSAIKLFRSSAEALADVKSLQRQFFFNVLGHMLRMNLSEFRVQSLLNVFLTMFCKKDTVESPKGEKRKAEDLDIDKVYSSRAPQFELSLLGVAVTHNNSWFAERLLDLRANSSQLFLLDQTKIKILNAAIIFECEPGLINGLIKAGATIGQIEGTYKNGVKESILSIMIKRICSTANISLRKELIEQLHPVIQLFLSQHGVDNYFAALYPAIQSIIESKDSKLMASCFGMLPSPFKQSLWDIFAMEGLYPLKPATDVKQEDFKLRFEMEFFFQLKEEELPLQGKAFRRILPLIQSEYCLLVELRARLRIAFANFEKPESSTQGKKSFFSVSDVNPIEECKLNARVRRLKLFFNTVNCLIETVPIDSLQAKSLLHSCYFAIKELNNFSGYAAYFKGQTKSIEELLLFLKNSLQESQTAQYQIQAPLTSPERVQIASYREPLLPVSPIAGVNPDESNVSLTGSR